jgi:hypothetical protein
VLTTASTGTGGVRRRRTGQVRRGLRLRAAVVGEDGRPGGAGAVEHVGELPDVQRPGAQPGGLRVGSSARMGESPTASAPARSPPPVGTGVAIHCHAVSMRGQDDQAVLGRGPKRARTRRLPRDRGR